MRNLIEHYCDVVITESTAFGLGSGVDLLFLESEENDPAVIAFGRSLTMEADLALALGIDYRETPELDDQLAWNMVRREVIAGRPTMLSGDVYYMKYLEAKVHFPSHRFVLVGFDDERSKAYIADRREPDPQECSYEELALARNPPASISTYNLWGKFYGAEVQRSMREAVVFALEKSARRMLGYDESQVGLIRAVSGGRLVRATTGLAGLARYAEVLPAWSEREDVAAIASYAAGCIEKFGTGGGNFRKLFADFLREAIEVVPEVVGSRLPELADQSADMWSLVSESLFNLDEEAPEKALESCAGLLDNILEVETDLFESLNLAVRTDRH
jgi:hypothetical protein